MVSDKIISYCYIILAVILTVYGQLIVKWQVDAAGAFPNALNDKFWFLVRLIINPWVISSFTCSFLALLAWMAALTKFPLNYAYPLFISLTFTLVILFSTFFFRESITLSNVIGIALIIGGIIIGSQK